MVYQRGQIVLQCQPFSYIVEFSVRSKVCDFCLDSMLDKEKYELNFKRCSKCQLVYYCSTKCQKNAWLSYHKKECIYQRKLRKFCSIESLMNQEISPIYFALFISRIYEKLKVRISIKRKKNNVFLTFSYISKL